MKRFLLSLSVLGLFGITNGQTVIFEDSFETYDDFIIDNVGEWTLIDADGLGTYGFNGVEFTNSGVAKSFQVFNSTTTTPPLTPSASSDWSGYESTKVMACFAAVPSDGNFNNDYLITPQITLGTTNTFSFMYKAAAADYSQEKFVVHMSTTGTAVEDFTPISEEFTIAQGDISWQEFTYQVPAANDGQNVYFAVQCKSQDQFGFIVDNFKVVTEVLATNDFESSKMTTVVSPNPAKDHVNIKLAEDYNASKISISLTNMAGKKVATFAHVDKVDVAKLPAGVYILTITDGNKTESKKIIKK